MGVMGGYQRRGETTWNAACDLGICGGARRWQVGLPDAAVPEGFPPPPPRSQHRAGPSRARPPRPLRAARAPGRQGAAPRVGLGGRREPRRRRRARGSPRPPGPPVRQVRPAPPRPGTCVLPRPGAVGAPRLPEPRPRPGSPRSTPQDPAPGAPARRPSGRRARGRGQGPAAPLSSLSAGRAGGPPASSEPAPRAGGGGEAGAGRAAETALRTPRPGRARRHPASRARSGRGARRGLTKSCGGGGVARQPRGPGPAQSLEDLSLAEPPVDKPAAEARTVPWMPRVPWGLDILERLHRQEVLPDVPEPLVFAAASP